MAPLTESEVRHFGRSARIAPQTDQLS
jgi:hypothetical protein